MMFAFKALELLENENYVFHGPSGDEAGKLALLAEWGLVNKVGEGGHRIYKDGDFVSVREVTYEITLEGRQFLNDMRLWLQEKCLEIFLPSVGVHATIRLSMKGGSCGRCHGECASRREGIPVCNCEPSWNTEGI